jgi:hypothetical protein
MTGGSVWFPVHGGEEPPTLASAMFDSTFENSSMKNYKRQVARAVVRKPLDDAGTVVIIPARNEANTIGQVVSQTRRYSKNVVVVDDRSEDGTARIALQFAARVIPSAGPVGYGNALRTGFEYARSSGFSTLVTLDGDGAHNPSNIRTLLAAHVGTGSSVTVGDRFAQSHLTVIPSSKRLANHFASYLFHRVLGTSLRDVACGLRCIAAPVADRLLNSRTSPGFGFLVELLKVASLEPGGIGSAPVDVRYNAAELLCTKQEELLDVLVALAQEVEPNSELAALLARLNTNVGKLCPITVVLPDVVLCVLPIPEAQGYIFQAQHFSLSNQRIGETFDLRE